jgi:uncharacterized delta-60 repeat protein
MTPRYKNFPTALVICLALLIAVPTWYKPTSYAQGQVQVSTADPMSAEQGTINLNVKVTGKGFKNGAKAKWFVTGTTDTGGVTVNSTTFVSSSELTANITVSDAATIANFDIQVTNSDGRGGKGTELFAVTPRGNAKTICPPMAPPPSSDTKCYANQPGCLDSTLGGGLGFVRTHFGDSTTVNAMMRQPDGKILLAGRTLSSPLGSGLMVMRYNMDGSLDTTFGDEDPANPPMRLGAAVSSANPSSTAYGIALQPDGKIVAVAEQSLGGNALVLRYNPNGTLDAGFGNSGIAVVSFGNKGTPNSAIALQSDGRIVIAGRANDTMGLARLLPSGSLDPSFGSSGKLTINPSGSRTGSSFARSIVIQRVPATTGEERIVIGGSSTGSSGNSNWTLLRLRSSGATDITFGTNGVVKTAFAGFGDSVRRISLDSNNRIIAAGDTQVANISTCGTFLIDYGVARYLENGALDSSFQQQTIDVYGGLEEVLGLTVQPDNKVIIVGQSNSSDFTVTDFSIVRLNTDGSRDFTFGLWGNGVVTTNLFAKDNYATAVTVDPTDGKIIVAGTSTSPINGKSDAVLARYLP